MGQRPAGARHLRWRLEVAEPRIALRVGGRTALAFDCWEPLDHCEHFDVRRMSVEPSPMLIPPIHGDRVRAAPPTDETDRWWRYWATQFFEHLREPSQSLIESGEWLLQRCQAPTKVAAMGSSPHATDEDFYISSRSVPTLPRAEVADDETFVLGFGHSEILPWRRLSSTHDGRVKSWRKHARDGTLPPLLLRFEPLFYSFFLVDGHDRLQAARCEDVAPPCLAVVPVRLLPKLRPRPAVVQALESSFDAFVNDARVIQSLSRAWKAAMHPPERWRARSRVHHP